MFQRSHSDLYSLLPYVNGPYRLSSSNAFVSQRWLNKNAEKRCRPWPLTSLKHTYKCRANSYLSCHSKCSARQRSRLTCYSMHIFSLTKSCSQSFKSNLLQPFILGQKGPALSLSNRETLKWSNHLCFSNYSVRKKYENIPCRLKMEELLSPFTAYCVSNMKAQNKLSIQHKGKC